MKYLVTFILIFIPVFLVDFFLIKKRKLRKKSKNKKIDELEFICYKHKINISEFNIKRLCVYICLINSFIISFVGSLVVNLDLAYYYQLLIAFVLLFASIYVCYEIFGRILKKKEVKKNEL